MRFIIFGVIGIFGSVIATCLRDIVVSRRIVFTGEASILLFPIWGLIAFIYPLIGIHLGKMPWYGRGIIYMVAFYVFQLFIGLGLSKINLCPWKYSGGSSFFGLIRLADAPIWFLAGLAVEWIYPFVKYAAAAV